MQGTRNTSKIDWAMTAVWALVITSGLMIVCGALLLLFWLSGVNLFTHFSGH